VLALLVFEEGAVFEDGGGVPGEGATKARIEAAAAWA
jgi:hypothetical protein